jgi:tetratricopeptide (TPR) repeat protein
MAAPTILAIRRWQMNKRMWIALLLVVLGISGLFALDEGLIEEADTLYDDDQAAAALPLLEEALGTARNNRERAEVYWRLSRVTLELGEQAEDRNAPEGEVLDIYHQGEQYGIQAVEADPNNHLGYYWQSANVGKWGQRKGILNSLFKAAPMRDLLHQAIEVEPNHADSYYVLGQLYAEVPGFISFGNDDYAVSLARLSIDLHEAEMETGVADEIEYDYYIQLASHLIQRNWDEGKREREQDKKRDRYEDADDVLERGWYYEGIIEIPDQSDREEAEELLNSMIALLRAKPDRTSGNERQLERALGLLEEL